MYHHDMDHPHAEKKQKVGSPYGHYSLLSIDKTVRCGLTATDIMYKGVFWGITPAG